MRTTLITVFSASRYLVLILILELEALFYVSQSRRQKLTLYARKISVTRGQLRTDTQAKASNEHHTSFSKY